MSDKDHPQNFSFAGDLYLDDGEKIHCPGVGDDTASVVVLLLMAKYFVEKKLIPQKGVLFVCNACEEGLGNLKGTRQIFKDYDGRIKQFVTFESGLNLIANHCVGSHRYEVEVLTEGGHSFSKFGKENAIAKLAKIVTEIYKIEVPQKKGTKTTNNVGTISGGTSVNTIAQNAKMLCEYRSDDYECLLQMQEKFEKIFAEANTKDVCVKINKVGDRPCSNTSKNKIDAMTRKVIPMIEEISGKEIMLRIASTDCRNSSFSRNSGNLRWREYTVWGTYSRRVG